MIGNTRVVPSEEIRKNSMYVAVYEFNKARNQFAFNAEHEQKMFNEEKKEFYEANSLAERVDALVDCKFVALGTQMKMDANGILKAPYHNDVYLMENILREEIEGISNEVFGCHDGRFEKIMRKAETIVCQANELKTKQLDKNGKVIKGDIPNATELIAKMIDKVLSDD